MSLSNIKKIFCLMVGGLGKKGATDYKRFISKKKNKFPEVY